MKVLVAHNRYRSGVPSGENRVVDAEIELLKGAGVEVVTMLEESDSISDTVLGAVASSAPGPLYSPAGVRRFRALMNAEHPDVVHVHNVFPLISPWVVRAAHAAGVPVVHTVHNYRHSCVKGVHFRDGQVCTECDRSLLSLPSVRHGCYRDSRLQSLPMAVGQVAHSRTWRAVDAIIALTDFMRERLVRQGFPGDRITVRPTWVPDPGEPTSPGTDALFVGRLDQAKGIPLLLQAWQAGSSNHKRLRIIGDGPLRPDVERASARDPRIRFEGPASKSGVSDAMRSAGVVVVPSLWFEGYPLVVAEAFGHGRPVLTVAGGATATIVDSTCGWVTSSDPRHLARTIAQISEGDIAKRARGARARYDSDNRPDQALRALVSVYRGVIG